VRNKYQRKERKSNHKFEVVRGQELLLQVPLPMAEVWAEMQAQVKTRGLHSPSFPPSWDFPFAARILRYYEQPDFRFRDGTCGHLAGLSLDGG
jgi:hypothetical protein